MAPPIWTPHPENLPQGAAYSSLADESLYGGAAGGGKSDLLLGLALTSHRKSIIFRREYEQLKSMVDRSREIVGLGGRYNAQDKIFRLDDGRVIEFGAVKDLGDEQKFMGRPHDFIGFDELAHFTEAQYRFLCGWNRTTEEGQRCRIVCSSNPPATAEGEWMVRRWGPWLDPSHPDPAGPGELRWFVQIDGADVEVPGPEEIKHNKETLKPRSRTFVPAGVMDNPYLARTEYVATLQALPEPLRSLLLEGKFGLGQEDDPWQVIPTDWIRIAQDRWGKMPEPKGIPMTAIGVDVAQGGGAETVLSPRRGNWFAPLVVQPGKSTPDGPSVAALVMATARDGAQVNIDVSGGWGGSAYDHLSQAGVPVHGCNGSTGSGGRTRDGKLSFRNSRAEWWWRLREALDPDYGDPIALPQDTGLMADLSAPRWRLLSGGAIQIELKGDIIKRLGRSPDKGDAAVYSFSHDGIGRKRGFMPAHSDSNYSRLSR